jgi:hypothetical protein
MLSLMSLRSKSLTSSPADRYGSVAVRVARAEDDAAIRRVAALDGKELPEGVKLVAEADTEIIAALPIHGGEPVADPFRWTADVVALMKLRARQLERTTLEPVPAGAGQAVQPLRTQLT